MSAGIEHRSEKVQPSIFRLSCGVEVFENELTSDGGFRKHSSSISVIFKKKTSLLCNSLIVEIRHGVNIERFTHAKSVMPYETDRDAVFAKMIFHRNLNNYAEFLVALHTFYSKHKDKSITADNLSPEERNTARDQFFVGRECRINVEWMPTIPRDSISNYSKNKIRSMISGCQILRIELFPVLIAKFQEAITFSSDDIYSVYHYLRLCERLFEINLDPDGEIEQENNDFMRRVCLEYQLAD